MSTNRHHIAHVEIIRVIHAVLFAHGVEEPELPGAVAEIVALTLEDIEGEWRTPRTLRDWQLLVAFVAKDWVVEEGGRVPVELGELPIEPEGKPSRLFTMRELLRAAARRPGTSPAARALAWEEA